MNKVISLIIALFVLAGMGSTPSPASTPDPIDVPCAGTNILDASIPVLVFDIDGRPHLRGEFELATSLSETDQFGYRLDLHVPSMEWHTGSVDARLSDATPLCVDAYNKQLAHLLQIINRDVDYGFNIKPVAAWAHGFHNYEQTLINSDRAYLPAVPSSGGPQ